MKKRFRKAAVLLAAVIFMGSSTMVGYQFYQYHLGDQAYTQAEELVDLPDLSTIEAVTLPPLAQLPEESIPLAPLPAAQDEASAAQAQPLAEEAVVAEPQPEEEKVVWVDPYADALAAMDFTALRQVNEDVLGWITIPGTKLSYPLLQGDDNDRYLNTTWRGTRSSVGSIFMEWQNSSDFSDFNTIIYGHRVGNSSMFGSLKKYAHQDHWQAHPYIYVTDDSGCKVYAIFAAYEVGVKEQTYRLGFNTEESRQDFVDFCVSQSVIDTGLVPASEDSFITLSTCTGRGHETRWVVQGVLI